MSRPFSEEEKKELAEFVQEMRFDRMGCFAYSEEEGTVAARMENQVDEAVRIHRAELLMEQQMQIAAECNAARVGIDTEAVIEGYDHHAGAWLARTAADAPDIDGRLYLPGTPADGLEIGQFVQVHITDTVDDYDLTGEVTAF